MMGVSQVIGNKADLVVLLLRRAGALREDFGRRRQREELRERGKRGRGADRFQERPAHRVFRKDRAHRRRGHDGFVTRLLSIDGGALRPVRRRAIMLAAVRMPAAGAASVP